MIKTELDGKVAVVTGAGRGIGRAIAEAFGAAGATVVCAARTQSDLDDAVRAIEATGSKALGVATDVTDRGAVEALFARVDQEYGRLDILFINAGGSIQRASVEESDPDLWTRTVELNLFGAYYCARAAIGLMRRSGGGSILTMGSGLGHHGNPGGSSYSSAKAGLWMLTRILAQELWEDGISVNEIIPGPVMTQRNMDAQDRSSVFSLPNEWVKEPKDVVPLALFLAAQPGRGPSAQSFSLMRRDT